MAADKRKSLEMDIYIYTHVCVCLCVCVCASVSACLSVSLCVSVSACLSVCLPACLAGWLSVRWSVGLSVCLAVCLCVFYVYLFIYSFIHLCVGVASPQRETPSRGHWAPAIPFFHPTSPSRSPGGLVSSYWPQARFLSPISCKIEDGSIPGLPQCSIRDTCLNIIVYIIYLSVCLSIDRSIYIYIYISLHIYLSISVSVWVQLGNVWSILSPRTDLG